MPLSCYVPSQIIPKSRIVHLADKQILKRHILSYPKIIVSKNPPGGGAGGEGFDTWPMDYLFAVSGRPLRPWVTSKRLWSVDTVRKLWLCPSGQLWNIKVALIAAHLNLMQKSYWWWQPCSDRYIISLHPRHRRPLIPPSPGPFSVPVPNSSEAPCGFLWTLSTLFTYLLDVTCFIVEWWGLWLWHGKQMQKSAWQLCQFGLFWLALPCGRFESLWVVAGWPRICLVLTRTSFSWILKA